MQMIASHRGQLQILKSDEIAAHKIGFKTGLELLDDLAGPQAFSRGAVHEILAEPNQALPFFFATLLARAASGERAIVWSDPQHLLYPPAIAAAGIPLDRLFL